MSNSTYIPTDRRPIASRDRQFFQNLSVSLANKKISANTISLCGMYAACIAGIFLALTSYVDGIFQNICFLLAATCIQLRLTANLLDGMVAIQSKKASRIGELFNEIPDRVSDTAILVGLSLSVGASPLLGVWAALLAMFTAYVRNAGKVAGASHFYIGPMAKQHRMFLVTLCSLYLAVTPSSWHSLFNLQNSILLVICVGCVFTVYRRLSKIVETLAA